MIATSFRVLLVVALAAGSVTDPPEVATDFSRGRIVEVVESESEPGQRFAVYVPAGYDASRPAPVPFLMDPRGRARFPTELFRAAAERYGYILISSHDTTSDGPMEPNLRAIQAMWADAHAWFRIDDRRTYLAGFSGTARMSSLLTHHLRGTFTGVVGAGAGFHEDYPPSTSTPFLYFGAAGDADYNFHEIEELEDRLSALDLPHRVERFTGPHGWLPPGLATEAVEWLELRAMQDGLRARDEALIDAWWARDAAAAEALEAGGRPVEASRRYAAMARDYAGLRETSGAAGAAGRLARSAGGARQLEARRQATRQFKTWIAGAMDTILDAFLLNADQPGRPAEDVARDLEIGTLSRLAAGSDAAEALEATRRLNAIGVQLGFYLPYAAIEREEYGRAAYYLDLALRIDDSSPTTWYLTAQTHAHLHQPREARAALQRAADAGFRDLASLESDDTFARLRQTREYRAVVESLGVNGNAPDVPGIDRLPVRRR